MQLTSRNTIESTVAPGVKFTVRRLGSGERAERDLQTMEPRRKCAALSRAWRAALPALLPDGKTFANPAEDTDEARSVRAAADEEYMLLGESAIKPAAIRAALTSIENLSIDGKMIATAKEFLAARCPATDALADEIYQACEEASGLTDEERKNLLPPTTSNELAAGETTDSTVTPASA